MKTAALRAAGRAADAPLEWRLLRPLTVAPADHPRGQPHLSAASGLVCAFGRVYVVADDEHHLGVFDDAASPGRLHRLLEGDLPRDAKARKAHKADLETLMWVPGSQGGGMLWLLGSGSAPGRDRAVAQPLDSAGVPSGAARVVDLAPLYAPLRQRLGGLNVEGAVLRPDDGLWLLHRGGSGERGANAVAQYAWPEVAGWLCGAPDTPTVDAAPALEPARLSTVSLGAVRGVGYGFTDAVGLPASLGGGILFTAVAEDSTDSVADGACVGSALGRLGPEGDLCWLRPLRGGPKVEGLALHVGPETLTLCLATDADDPAVASQLLLAHLPRAALDGSLR